MSKVKQLTFDRYEHGLMVRALYEDINKITYHREGDYLIPDLLPPPAPHIGVWGQRRKRYLQQYHDDLYGGFFPTDQSLFH